MTDTVGAGFERGPAHATAAADAAVLALAPAGREQRRLALLVVLVSAAFFAAAVPFAQLPLRPVWAFIPVYQTAFIVCDLVTGALLFGQFSILRTPALLALASGYLFTALMAIAHGLTFPGLFADGGLLGAGPQSTAWLYMFWHGGFPLLVIVYALAKRHDEATLRAVPAGGHAAIALAVMAALAAAVAFTALATAGQGLLPPIMRGHNYTPAMISVVSTVWALSLLALVALWWRRPHALLDVWLMVVMCVWMCDIALAGVLSAERFDLGFYAGSIYGLLAGSFVLIVLLVESGGLHARLARSVAQIASARGHAEALVRERTTQVEQEAEARRQAGETLQAVVDETPVATIGLDPERRVMIWNRAAERIFGYAADDVIGRPYPLVPQGHEAEFDEIFRRSASGERLRNYPVRRRRQDGQLVDIVFSGAPLYAADGRHRGIMFVLEDVTERNLVEQQLRQAQKMEAVGQLTGGLAHDFNNLLTVIIGNLQLLEQELGGRSAQHDFVATALEGAFRGAELTRQLLVFSRHQALQPEVVKINAFIGGTTRLLQRTLGEAIEVSTSLADDLWSAEIDPSQVESALMNLAVNARDAMPSGGRLTIETANKRLDDDYVALNPDAVAGDYVMLAVSDTGAGIAPDILERVFEPFFTTKEAGKGTGLGLSMVYGFVKQSGGHIKIYSEVGLGTTVRLYLPRATAGAARPEQEVEHVRPGGGETVLVVDDNDAVRATVVAQLRHLGYRVREAANGREAMATLQQVDGVDLLFTDVVMPGGMSGLALAEQARAMRPHIKVLFTSGFQGAAQDGSGLRPADVLLSKPYRIQDLAKAIRGILEPAG